MIDIEFKHGCPEDVWFTCLDPDNKNDARNLYRLFNVIDEVESITVTKVSRYIVQEHFKNLLMPTTMPKSLFFFGDFARQIVGQLIVMAIHEEPFLMGYFPITK